MGLNSKNKEFTGGSNRVEQEALEAGTYPVRVVQVIDLGVQEQREWEGKAKPPAQEIMVTYEFLDEFVKDEDGNDLEDKPRWLSERFVLYNLAAENATSTKRYYAIDVTGDKEGDWSQLIGFPAMVTVAVQITKNGKNKGKKYNKITNVAAVRAKDAARFPELKNPGKVFSTDDVDTIDAFFSLPTWLQDVIKGGIGFEGTAMDKAIATYKKDDTNDVKEKKKPVKKEDVVEDDKPPFDTDEKASDEEEDWG